MPLFPASAAAGSDITLSDENTIIVAVVAGIGILALAVAAVFRSQVLAADEGPESMRRIATAIQEGAAAYLNRQFRTLALFVVIVGALLFLLPGDQGVRVGRSVAFLGGAVFSALIGYLGMWLAVRANVRVAAAAREADGREEGMRLSFRTGGVVGMGTVGLGLVGAAVVVLLFEGQAPGVLEGFGFGAALLAMFMRVGGGIFTKAADVGADLVGKVEKNIPEDDPRNAATIADNVGDNVGDCAGMAADLFESYAVTLVAGLILGRAAFGESGLVLPLIIPAIGAVTAVLGVLAVRVRAGEGGLVAINRGFYLSAVVSAIISAVAVYVYLPTTFAEIEGAPQAIGQLDGDPRLIVSIAIVIGIALAGVVMWLTGYFTGTTSKPTNSVADTSRTGAATVVLSGVGLGLESAVFTVAIIGGAIYLLFLLAGSTIGLALFLIAIAGTGLLTTVGVIVAMDTFGPVSDNAQGIAEMSGEVDDRGTGILTELDAVGNTTKAITKGIAITTAVLAATALFGSYTDAVNAGFADIGQIDPTALSELQRSFVNLDVITPPVLVGVLLGAAVVFLFSGLTINSVGRAAGAVVFEVRRQFRDKPGIMDGTETPEYARVVDICTRTSLRELITPGLLAALAPIAVGFGLGISALAGFLAGAIGAGSLMAVFLANSGGAWDNAKKIVEDGRHGGKGSEAHAATVIGDTVGDPFKDTAGPAINPLIKVMNLVAVLVAPAIVVFSFGPDESPTIRYGIAGLAAVVIVVAVAVSRSRSVVLGDPDAEAVEPPATEPDEPTAALDDDIAVSDRNDGSRIRSGVDPAVDPAVDPVGDETDDELTRVERGR
jgi:K(+)-stimulated pyrophosphate-energized sodium pump